MQAFNLLNHTNRPRVGPNYTNTFDVLVEAQNNQQVELMLKFECQGLMKTTRRSGRPPSRRDGFKSDSVLSLP